MAKFLLLSATSWLLIAVLTNIIGNAVPILFQFQQYFLSCAVFGLGLGFFQEARFKNARANEVSSNHVSPSDASPNDAQVNDAQANEAQVNEAQASDASPNDAQANEAQVNDAQVNEASSDHVDVSKIPDKNSKNRFGNMETGWAIWLAIVTVLLLLVTFINHPGGLANAVTLALLDESADAAGTSFIRHELFTDCLSLGLCAILLFACTQIFVGPGRELKRLHATGSLMHPLIAIAAGGALGWMVYALLTLLSVPPSATLTMICIVYVTASDNRKICAGLSALAVACCLYTGACSFSAADKVPDQYKTMVRTFWANGSRIDTEPIFKDEKLLGVTAFLDRSLCQILPAPTLTAEDASYIQKRYGLPEFAVDYRELPYRTIAQMTGKDALILGSGIGSEAAECLKQGLSHITAVEPQKWLTKVAAQSPFSPYANSAVKLIVDDPCQYLRRTKGKYDLIIYTGHSAVNRPSPFAILNHDDFLFTFESLATAYAQLKPDGQMIIASPAADEGMRARLAATMLGLSNRIDAVLTTPYANYLILGKIEGSTASKSTTAMVEQLRRKFGGTIVNHEQWMVEGARTAAPFFDNRPFLFGTLPMMPVADTFFVVVTMLAQLFALRLQMPQSMLQNITRQKCRVFLLGMTFMVLMCKACMLMSFQFGTRPPAIYGSIIFGWMLLAIASALSGRQNLLPTWILRTAFLIALVSDCAFNYESACWLSHSTMEYAAVALMPWVATFFAALIVAREIRQSQAPAESLGLCLMGFSLGCLLPLTALFNGIASLDVLAASIAALSLCFTRLPARGQQGIINPT